MSNIPGIDRAQAAGTPLPNHKRLPRDEGARLASFSVLLVIPT